MSKHFSKSTFLFLEKRNYLYIYTEFFGWFLKKCFVIQKILRHHKYFYYMNNKMPYVMRKIKNTTKYRVKNKKTGDIKAYSTTKSKAIKQIKLLESIDKLKK